MDKAGDALKIISQRLDEQASEKVAEMIEGKRYNNTFDLLEQMSEEWDKAMRESYKGWDRVYVVDEKEYRDVVVRLKGIKDIGD